MLVTEQDFIVIGVAQIQNKKVIADCMPFSLRTKRKAIEGYRPKESYDMTMLIISITGISWFSDPKIYFLQASSQRKVLKHIFKILKTALQMCMEFPSYSKGQGNSIFENVSGRDWKLKVLGNFWQYRTKQADMIRKHPRDKWSSLD